MSIETAHPRHAHVAAGGGGVLRILDERIEAKLAERDTAGADARFEAHSPPGSEALDGEPPDGLLEIAEQHGLGVPPQRPVLSRAPRSGRSAGRRPRGSRRTAAERRGRASP